MVPLFLPLSFHLSVPSCSIPCQPSRALPLHRYWPSSFIHFTELFVSFRPIRSSLSHPPCSPSFSLALNPLSPCISHYVPSLTLSPRSSAKTSIRLSPVAPRYTDPTRASRRVPRVLRGNVDPTSLSSRRHDTSHTSVARHVLPARDSQYVMT